MTESAWGFPITGSVVSEVLRGTFGANEIWRVSDIDVPSEAESSLALSGLREAVASGPRELSTGDLCDALAGAPQVWGLDIRLSSDEGVQLYIEDGEVFEEHLVRVPRFCDAAVSDEAVGRGFESESEK